MEPMDFRDAVQRTIIIDDCCGKWNFLVSHCVMSNESLWMCAFEFHIASPIVLCSYTHTTLHIYPPHTLSLVHVLYMYTYTGHEGTASPP